MDSKIMTVSPSLTLSPTLHLRVKTEPGSGEVIEPDDGTLAIGSGGAMALAAARALCAHSNLAAPEIVHQSLEIAGEICIYSNTEITVLELGAQD